MTIEEIRKNAPDGATHYNDKFEYFKKSGSALWRWIGKWLYLRNCDDPDEYCRILLKPYNWGFFIAC